jgi:hypothetical protein
MRRSHLSKGRGGYGCKLDDSQLPQLRAALDFGPAAAAEWICFGDESGQALQCRPTPLTSIRSKAPGR